MLEEGVAQRGEEPAQSVRGREAGKVASGNRDRSRDRSRGRSRGKSRDKCGSEEARGGWEVGKWREVASMRTARTHHCCAAIDGLILAIGGTDGEKVLRTVECYDTARPEAGWVPVRPLAHPREGASAVVLGDSVYVIGGHDGNAHLCSVEVWSSKLHRESAGHWRPVSSLVQQRSALAAVSVGKALVALGGYCGRGGARMTSCEMWHPKDSDPRKVGFCSTLLLYFTTLFTTGFNLLATSEYLDTRNSQWVRGPSLPNPRRGACSVALGARLLIFGGWDGSQHLRDAHWMVQILGNPICNELIQ